MSLSTTGSITILFPLTYLAIAKNLKGIPKDVTIRGYFLGDTSVAIISNEYDIADSSKYCIPKSIPDWKQKVGVLISEIKSIFEK